MRVQSAASRDTTLPAWRALFIALGLLDALLCLLLLRQPLAAALLLSMVAALAATSALLAPTFPRLMRLEARILAAGCLVVLLGLLAALR